LNYINGNVSVICDLTSALCDGLVRKMPYCLKQMYGCFCKMF